MRDDRLTALPPESACNFVSSSSQIRPLSRKLFGNCAKTSIQVSVAFRQASNKGCRFGVDPHQSIHVLKRSVQAHIPWLSIRALASFETAISDMDYPEQLKAINHCYVSHIRSDLKITDGMLFKCMMQQGRIASGRLVCCASRALALTTRIATGRHEIEKEVPPKPGDLVPARSWASEHAVVRRGDWWPPNEKAPHEAGRVRRKHTAKAV